jgi:CheY-like chemotaxis protein
VEGRILVVEDEPAVREAFLARLTAEGFETITADDGRDGLKKLRTGPLPDVILLDYAMPVMDGRAFLENKLRDERSAAIPVILITAHVQRAFASHSLDVAAILEKPVQWDELERLLRKYCKPGRAARRRGPSS